MTKDNLHTEHSVPYLQELWVIWCLSFQDWVNQTSLL